MGFLDRIVTAQHRRGVTDWLIGSLPKREATSRDPCAIDAMTWFGLPAGIFLILIVWLPIVKKFRDFAG